MQAALWGLLAGAALVLGAGVAWCLPVPRKLIAAIMAFGAGVLISALAFERMDEAYARGGFGSTALGFLGGAAVWTGANRLLSHRGARHRKRSQGQQSTAQAAAGSGRAIAVGALRDGIPESIVIGLSLLQGGAVSVVTVAAIFLSMIPEAFEKAHAAAGLVTVAGFLASFALSRLGG